MKNNACTVILNGHGCYSKNEKMLDISQSNYNIVFTCPMKNSASNVDHNYLLYSLAQDIQFSWKMLESAKTTRVANKNIPKSFIVDTYAKDTSFIYEHGLSNSEDVNDVNTFVDIDPNRFSSYILEIDPNVRKWNGQLSVELDHTQIKTDVIQAHQVFGYQYNIAINMSANNLLFLKPIAPQNVKITLKLSDLLYDIFPKIKIPVSYHQNGTVDIIPSIFLDDNIQNKQQIFSQNYSNIFDIQNDIYHEVVIAGDANIIWDSCRVEI